MCAALFLAALWSERAAQRIRRMYGTGGVD
jgi:hypothetical protein